MLNPGRKYVPVSTDKSTVSWKQQWLQQSKEEEVKLLRLTWKMQDIPRIHLLCSFATISLRYFSFFFNLVLWLKGTWTFLCKDLALGFSGSYYLCSCVCVHTVHERGTGLYLMSSGCISLRCRRVCIICPLYYPRIRGPVLGKFTPTSHELQGDHVMGSAHIRSEPHVDIIGLENLHVLEMCFVVMCEETINFKMLLSILPN